jgi:hypothetical protein
MTDYLKTAPGTGSGSSPSTNETPSPTSRSRPSLAYTWDRKTFTLWCW